MVVGRTGLTTAAALASDARVFPESSATERMRDASAEAHSKKSRASIATPKTLLEQRDYQQTF